MNWEEYENYRGKSECLQTGCGIYLHEIQKKLDYQHLRAIPIYLCDKLER